MIAVTDPQRFAASLGGSGRDTFRVEIWARQFGQTGEQLTDRAPVETCWPIKETWATGVRMSCNLSAPATRQWLRWLEFPFVEAQLYRGVQLGSTLMEVPAGVYPLRYPGLSAPGGKLEWQGVPDRWSWVVGDKGPALRPSFNGEIRRVAAALIDELGIDVPTDVQATSAAAQPVESWDKGRSETIGERVDAIGAEAFFNRIGRPVVRDRTAVDTGETLRSGRGGTVIQVSDTPNHPDVRNIIYVSSSNPDVDFGTVEAAISNPLHPANPNKIGRFSEAYASPLLADPLQALQAGLTILQRKSVLARKVTITCVADIRREVGDRVTVQTSLGTYPVVIEDITTDRRRQTIVAAVDVAL